MSGLEVAVLGATGAVGREMWSLLEASSLPITHIRPYTTLRSHGKELSFRGEQVNCLELGPRHYARADLVLASAGAAVSKEWAPRFAADGGVVVDNSSAFRGDPDSPLVVPEINAHALSSESRIIANPNCSTIQMVMALFPLHQEWTLERIKVATYQSVSGAGERAIAELTASTRAHLDGTGFAADVFPHPIAFEALPHIGPIDASGESQEEKKMRDETRRILDLAHLPVSATCVRVPVYRGHSEAVWATFRREPEIAAAQELLHRAGVVVEDDPANAIYPLARRSQGRDEVFVGRLRRDPSEPHGLAMWVVSDNLRKGAATNAFQIALELFERGLLPSRGGA